VGRRFPAYKGGEGAGVEPMTSEVSKEGQGVEGQMGATVTPQAVAPSPTGGLKERVRYEFVKALVERLLDGLLEVNAAYYIFGRS